MGWGFLIVGDSSLFSFRLLKLPPLNVREMLMGLAWLVGHNAGVEK